MSDPAPLPRSMELMNRDDTALLVVDVQEKFAPIVRDFSRMVWNIRRLIDAARAFDIPVAATEQYPRGLGQTVEELRSRLDDVPDKTTFSCTSCAGIFADWQEQGRHKVLVTGIEAHVCVQQTSLDLLAAGFRVYLAVDAVSARNQLDFDIGLRRLEASGATLTTTESVMFEWCETSSAPEFKTISDLAKESPPEGT